MSPIQTVASANRGRAKRTQLAEKPSRSDFSAEGVVPLGHRTAGSHGFDSIGDLHKH
jgi:hypothetical protein